MSNFLATFQVAWAPNIGVKESQFKDFWDLELGVTYIPWSSMPANLAPLLVGAIIDEETLPDHLKGGCPTAVSFLLSTLWSRVIDGEGMAGSSVERAYKQMQ